MDITKENYLKVRNEFVHGVLSNEGYQLLYEYWKNNRKDEYLNPDYNEFKASFSNYIIQGVAFNSMINTVLPYYDNQFAITTVTDKTGKVLTSF